MSKKRKNEGEDVDALLAKNPELLSSFNTSDGEEVEPSELQKHMARKRRKRTFEEGE